MTQLLRSRQHEHVRVLESGPSETRGVPGRAQLPPCRVWCTLINPRALPKLRCRLCGGGFDACETSQCLRDALAWREGTYLHGLEALDSDSVAAGAAAGVTAAVVAEVPAGKGVAVPVGTAAQPVTGRGRVKTISWKCPLMPTVPWPHCCCPGSTAGWRGHVSS